MFDNTSRTSDRLRRIARLIPGRIHLVLLLLTLNVQPSAHAQSSEPQPPVTNDDTYVVAEDTVLTVASMGVLANDSNVDGGELVAMVNSGPDNGTLTLHPDGTFTYIPRPDFNGTDQFTYIADTGEFYSEITTVTISVTPANDTPIARDDTASTTEEVNVTIAVLSNDTDVDGDVLHVSGVTQGLTGTVTIAPNGNDVAYAPSVDFHGSDQFTYTVSDGHGGQATGTVTIHVSPVNDAPTATHLTITTLEGQRSPWVTPQVTDVDLVTDPQREHHTFVLTVPPEHGEVSIGSAEKVGQVRVAWQGVSNPDLTGYRLYYGQTSGSYSAHVDAGDQTTYLLAGLTAGATYYFAATAYDRFGRESAFSEEIEYQLPTVGQVSYTPTDPDFHGTDTFTYLAIDSEGASVAGIAQVHVTPVNDVPVAVDDLLSTSEEMEITTVVLANDTDVDGDVLHVSSFTPAANGTVVESGNGVFTYTPFANFHGMDQFTYIVDDGNGGTATGNVTVTVTPENDLPVAQNDAISTALGVAIDVAPLANDSDVDGDPLTLESITSSANGQVMRLDDEMVRYTPNPGFLGVDQFTYTIHDGNGGVASATVTVTVGYAPVAAADAVTTAEDTPIDIAVLTNDTDPEGGVLQVSGYTPATHGILASTGNGILRYTPDADFHGSDNFTYTVIDPDGIAATSTVSIIVTPVNDAPTAVADTATLQEDTVVTISVLDNDDDVDGDPLAVVSSTQSAHGIVVRNGNLILYTPSLNFYGTDGLTYTVSDGNGGTSTASVSIIVTPANDTPIAESDTAVTLENTALELLLAGTDIDGDTLTFSIVSEPLHGVLSGTPPVVTYTPDADFNGYDSFRFLVDDGVAESLPATVAITTTAAGLTNGGFEQGDFTDWTTQGEARIETATFGSTPTEGVSQALLSTAGPAESADDPQGNAVAVNDLEAFLGIPPDRLADLSTGQAIEGSALKRTFTARAGDTVTFDWNFFTNENTNLDEPDSPPSVEHNDIAFVSILLEDTPTEHSLLSDSFWAFVLSPSDFFAETGFDTFSYTLPFTGTYTLGIGVVDVGDESGLSGLLVDNVVLTPSMP